MDADDIFGLQIAVREENLNDGPNVSKIRVDPRDIMTDKEFKLHFRFSKETV